MEMYKTLGSCAEALWSAWRPLNGWEIRCDERLDVRHGFWGKVPHALPVAYLGEDMAEKLVEDGVVGPAGGLAIKWFE